MIICFDLETTWLDKYKDEIIEIAMIKFDEKNFKIIDTFSTFINPEIDIPDIISNITNIFYKDVEFAPKLEDIKDEIKKFIWDSTLLWHNVFFDRDFLIEKWVDIKNNIIIDTFFLANFLNYDLSSLNLEYLCNNYNITFTWAHRAINDTKATILLFEKLIEKFNNIQKSKKDLLYFLFSKTDDKNIIFLKNLLFWDKNTQITFWSFEKQILKKIKKYQFLDEININKNIDAKKINNLFQNLWDLEIRENQEKMMNSVLNNLSNKWKLVIEAPTWLWKSYAYLLPSIIHSLNTKEKVFISTKTKNLQDQLFYKDLKFLSNNLSEKFNYTKLKWKKNYFSVNWFFNFILNYDFEYEMVSFFSKIVLWLHKTEFWELEELNYFGKEFSYLKNINADFLFTKNTYQDYEYLFKARQNLSRSNIVVINHSLLFSDIKSQNPILWKIDNLIIDEAHNVEDTLTDSVKKQFNLHFLLDLFWNIEKLMKKNNINTLGFINQKESLFSKLDIIIDYSFSYLNSKTSEENYYKSCLLNTDYFLSLELEALSKKIQLDFLDIIDLLSIINEYNFANEILILSEQLETIKVILDKNNENFIKIIWYNQNTWISLEYTLLSPWEYLYDNFYHKINSILLTSATLKIWNNFDYLKKVLCLTDFNFLSFESDFDYKKQATLFIPNDLWNIKSNSDNIINFLSKFYKIVWWKTLTLLTSFNIIKKIYISLNQDLKKQGINLFAQSIWWSKIKLLEFYNNSPSNSILLWTDSFWEWVDIPWDNLKYLIIHKFPFQVPNDPIFQARSKLFNDPFLDYSIPKAIIKLKQWFWRLIRSKTDTWIIILLDDRINSYKWWEEFYKAFPSEVNIKKWKSDKFLEILKSKS